MNLESPQAASQDNQEEEIELALRFTQAEEKLQQLAHSFTGGEYDRFTRLRRHLMDKMRTLEQMNPKDKKHPFLHKDILQLSQEINQVPLPLDEEGKTRLFGLLKYHDKER